jgi:serine/threonine protein kinase
VLWSNPRLNGNYMLVMRKFDINLKTYLQQYHNQLTWEQRIKITLFITKALGKIHKENAIHRDLHSGNVLYLQYNDRWYISDLGFCGPADKPLKSIYGNLPYIAPEVISGKGYTFKSDIYSVAMLMWEISSGQPPFINYNMNYNHDDFHLATKIMNGMRPEIAPGTPLKYKELMEQCWDTDPEKRPNIEKVRENIREIYLSYQNTQSESNTNNIIVKEKYFGNIYLSRRLLTSKVYQFEGFLSQEMLQKVFLIKFFFEEYLL